MDFCNFTNVTLSVKRIGYERGEALNSDGRKAVMFKKLVLAASASLAFMASANAETLVVETGTATGSTTLVMQVVANYGGMDLQINSGQTLTKACLKLGKGEIDVAVCPPTAHIKMGAGKGPFAKNADEAMAVAGNLRGLFAFSGGLFHPIVRDGGSIESWDDLFGQRVFTGPPSGSANGQSQAVIEAASGLKAGEDYEAVRLGWGAALQAFQDGQFDMMMWPSPSGNATIEQLGPIDLLSLTPEALETEVWKNYAKEESRDAGTIPAGAYSNVAGNSDVLTAEYTMQASVNMSMDDDTAYSLTKAFWENLDAAKGDIRTLSDIDPAVPFQGMSMKLHPGAIRYYEEMGFEIPADKR